MILVVYYNSVRYELVREGFLTHSNGRKIKVKDKLTILFDKDAPECSILLEDVEQSKKKYSAVAALLIGAFWLGIFFVALILEHGV